MNWTQITEINKVRQRNEDSVLASGDLGLFAVADGMGGHRAGEVASQMALSILEEYVRTYFSWEPIELILRAVKEANSLIYDKAKRTPSQKGMGTTFTGAILKDNNAYIAHVGDSRAYLIRDEDIIQLTVDHSFVQTLYDEGKITLLEAKNHPRKNVLTRALGVDSFVEIDKIILPLKENDWLLFCTDGLTGILEDEQIFSIIKTNDTMDKKAEALVDMAMNNGGSDNISLVLVQI